MSINPNSYPDSYKAYEHFHSLETLADLDKLVKAPLELIKDSSGDDDAVNAMFNLEDFSSVPDKDLEDLHKECLNVDDRKVIYHSGTDEVSKSDLMKIAETVKAKASSILKTDNGKSWIDNAVNVYKSSLEMLRDGVKKAHDFAETLLAA